MTDKELIARLRAVCTCNIDSTPCMAEDDCRDALAAADRIEALEAKLTQAVEALKDMCLEFRQADLPYGSAAYAKARATLAEIKGDSHE